jgi:hypothetical protein
MVFLWFSYGFPIVFLWFSYGFPMVFLWFSYGFLYIFPWDFSTLQVLVMDPIWPGHRLGDVVRLTCPLLVSAIDRYEKQGALRGEGLWDHHP